MNEYRSLLRYMKPFRLWYAAGVVSLLITSGFQLLIPHFLQQVIDALSLSGFQLKHIGKYLFFIVGAALVTALGRIGWRYFLGTAARRIETQFRDDLFDHLMELDSSFYQQTSVGDLMARATNDMQTIRMACNIGLVAAIDGIFITILVLGILFSQNPRVASFVILPFPIITALMIAFGKLIGPMFRKVQEGYSQLSEHTQDSFAGIRLIKSFVKEDFFEESFSEKNDEYRKLNMNLVSLHGIVFPLVMFLSGLATMILLLIGGRQAVLGDFSPGQLVSTLAYLQMLIWPMQGAGFTVNLFQRGAASLGRINRIMEYQSEVQNPPVFSQAPVGSSIVLSNMSVRRGDSSILENINLSIGQGQLVGITGPVGSGKTTLLNALPRITEASTNSISIGGRDIREFRLQDLRSRFGYVPQRSFLFSASIRDNIAFAKEELSDDELEQLTEWASLNQDFRLFPAGWQTVVGERGISISGGQKQRVSIARALAIEPEILLLDDPLSAVDGETEERILRRILQQRSGRTTVIVSHRISTLKQCQRIFVLEQGRVSQEGSHEALSSQPGYYQSIQNIQINNNAPGDAQ